MMEFLTGLWPLVWHYSAAALLIAVCLVGAWFTPTGKGWFVGAAAVVLVGLGGYTLGVSNESRRCSAQLSELYKEVDDLGAKARANAEASIPPVAAEPVAPPTLVERVLKHKRKKSDPRDRAD